MLILMLNEFFASPDGKSETGSFLKVKSSCALKLWCLHVLAVLELAGQCQLVVNRLSFIDLDLDVGRSLGLRDTPGFFV